MSRPVSIGWSGPASLGGAADPLVSPAKGLCRYDTTRAYVARAGIVHALPDFIDGSLAQPHGSGFRFPSIGSPSRVGEMRWSITAAANSPPPAPIELAPKSIN